MIVLRYRKVCLIFMGNSSDIKNKTEAQRRIAALEEENAALKAALQSAEATNEAKSAFLSNMSHDIRTPMNAIMGMTSIGLSHIDEKPRVHDCLLKIQTASSHLMSLVNDVLDMSRIDSGRLTLNEEAFSLPDLVHDIFVIIRPQAAQKNQTLQLEIGQIYEENLIGDPLHLRQILVNIIGNAVKYTQAEGHIKVWFGQHLPETENLKSQSVWLDFYCQDNGMGMSPEFLEKIFVPFERVHNEATSQIEGTGLGMAIVKKIIDRMDGRIHVTSTPNAGSCFRVELPIMINQNARKPLSVPQGQVVLVAECNGERAAAITDCLKASGLRPLHIKSGMETVTLLTEAEYEDHMPCAVFIGQELSDMPVLELASHVRQLAGETIPILLVSGEDWAQIEFRAKRAGVDAFVPCPLFRTRLMDTLCGLLNKNQKEKDGGLLSNEDYSQYRVLLVEDNELNQEIAMELLSMTGVSVEVAGNGAQAVELFEASPEGYFDLIFMDVQMPVMNGYEATRRIRQLHRRDVQSIAIVAMTANAFVEDIRLSREAGMNEHVSKPVDFEHLQEIMKKYFSSTDRSEDAALSG